MKNVISALVQKFTKTTPDQEIVAIVRRNDFDLTVAKDALEKANAQVRSAKSALLTTRRLNDIRLTEAFRRKRSIGELDRLAKEVEELESSIQKRVHLMEPLLAKWGGEVAISTLLKAAPRPGFAAEGEAADAPEPAQPAGVAPRPVANWEL
jgi:hypothetical protein